MGLSFAIRCAVLPCTLALCSTVSLGAGELSGLRTRGASATTTALTAAPETDNNEPAPSPATQRYTPPTQSGDPSLSGLLSENLARATETDSGGIQASYTLPAATAAPSATVNGAPVRTAPANGGTLSLSTAPRSRGAGFSLSPIEIALATTSVLGIGAGIYLGLRRRA